MQQLQDLAHPIEHDYRTRSPHLKHLQTYGMLVSNLRSVMAENETSTSSRHLLDVGAGDGAFVEPVLASGWSVTATEMSSSAVERLLQRYGTNKNFQVIYTNEDEPLPSFEQGFRVILYASVLHHIPDYLNATDQIISRHLEPGGSFLSFQDPIWYPSLTRRTYWFSKCAYYSWRLFQGNYRRGFNSIIRRLRGVYDVENLSDMAEYHVVRRGVNQDDLMKMLIDRFDEVTYLPYWSTQSSLCQRMGEQIGCKNVFGLVANGFKG